MSDALSTPVSKNRIYIFLALCGLFAIGAAIIGIDDNPPGVLLAYLAAFAFLLAFVHHWRSARQYAILLAASVFGIILFVVFDIIFSFVGQDPSTESTLQTLMQGLAEAFFFLGALVFPAGFIVGAIGAVVMLIRNRRR